MRTPYVFASETSHSVLGQQIADWAGGQTAAYKSLHLIRVIWQAVNLYRGCFSFVCLVRHHQGHVQG